MKLVFQLSLYELAKHRKNSSFQSANLHLAIDFIGDWEELIHSDTDEVLEMKAHINKCLKIEYVTKDTLELNVDVFMNNFVMFSVKLTTRISDILIYRFFLR